MKWIDVSSRAIRQVAYDEQTQTLHIKFRITPKVYRYVRVPSNMVTNLMNALSSGDYYMRNIKGRFPRAD